jgi:predicted ribosomally synthesized peptide with nif11-like leader
MGKVREFYEALVKDEAMQERSKGLGVTAETTAEAVAEAVVAFAKSEGYAFTAGELKDYGKELSDQELAAVAGGVIYNGVDKPELCLLGGRIAVANCVCPFVGYSYYKSEGMDGQFVCFGVGAWKPA